MPGHPLDAVDPNGRTQVEPSAVTKSILQTRSPLPPPSDRDTVALCKFASGPADTFKTFDRYGDLEAWHDSLGLARGVVTDDGVRYCRRTFNPSPDVNGAAKIHTLRVGDHIAATRHMPSSWEGDGYDMTTIDAGTQANKTRTKNTAASHTDVNAVGGIKVTIQKNANTQGYTEFALDNLGLPMYVRADVAAAGVSVVVQAKIESTHSKIHQAHDGVAGVNVTTEPEAYDLASEIVLLTAMRVDYNAHLTQAGVHWANDITNSVAVGALVTQGDVNTAANVLKAAFNLHRANSPATGYHEKAGVATADPFREITAPDATTEATAITLLNQIKQHYNAHLRGYTTDEVKTLLFTYNTPGAGYPASAEFTLDSDDTDTITELIEAINGTAGLNAKIFAGVDPSMPSKYLDIMDAASADIRSATAWYSLTALAHHPVWEMTNKAGHLVSVVKRDGWTGDRVNVVGYEKQTLWQDFAGGVTDTPNSTRYSEAIALLAAVDINVIGGGHLLIDTTDAAVRTAFKDFINEEKLLRNRQWRIVFASPDYPTSGLSIGEIPSSATSYRNATTDEEVEDVINDASSINHLYCGCAWQRLIDVNSKGNDELYGPLDVAAAMTGMSAGTRKTRPLSGLAINALTIYDQPSKTQRDNLLYGGAPSVIIKNRVPKINMMITTRQSQKRMEIIWSEVNAAIYIERSLYLGIKDLVPRWGGEDLVSRAKDLARAVFLREIEPVPEDGVALLSAGTDAAGNSLPPFDGIDATLLAGVLKVYGNGYIGGEVDHVFGTIRMEYQTFGVSLPA